MQISPLGVGIPSSFKSVDIYYISGISSNLNSQLALTPPTCPTWGSNIELLNVAPVVSVEPYPS
jgi:hypothetical protein